MKSEKNQISNINKEVRENVIRTFGLFFAVYAILCLIPSTFGVVMGTPLYYLVGGIVSYLLLALLLLTGLYMIFKKQNVRKLKNKYIFTIIALMIFICALISIDKNVVMNNATVTTTDAYLKAKETGNVLLIKGGFIGNLIFGTLNGAFDVVLAIVVISVLLLATLLFICLPFIKKLTRRVSKKSKKEVVAPKEDKEIEFNIVKDNNNIPEDLVEDSGTIHISGVDFNFEQKSPKKNYKIDSILKQFDEEIYPSSYLTRNKQEISRSSNEIAINEYSYNPYIKKEEKIEKPSTPIEVVTKPQVEEVTIKPQIDEVEVKNINTVEEKERTSRLSDEEYERIFGRRAETVKSQSEYSVNIEQPTIKEEVEVSIAHTSYEDLKGSIASLEAEEIKDVPSADEPYIRELNKEATHVEEVKIEPARDTSNDLFIRSENSNVFTLNIKEEPFVAPIKETTEINNNISETKQSEKLESKEEATVKEEEQPVVDLDTVEYNLPPLYLLKDAVNDDTNSKNEQIAMEKAEILMEKMKELNVQATINSFVVGPSVTRFEIKLAPGIRVNAFTNLQEDFKLALGVNSIRIESPIPGKPSTIGIEVPNDLRAMVSMKEVVASMPNKKAKLFVPVGKDVSGKALAFPIVDMPHCLISGATNSGKSVCANAIIMSMIMNYRPNEVRFIMVDPKHVEMTPYADIPHLLCPIITESSKAFVALDKLCIEMDRRFTVFAQEGVKNIASFNEVMEGLDKPKMSFIIVVIDEFAELMLGKNSDAVEERIQKLSQLGRACGIHLVLLTQRPDTNVISGTIKNNLPCRMTFRLSSFADSRTVIDVGGAEKLLNRGDMLLLTPDYTGLRRVQGVFVSDDEITNVVNYVKKQLGPHYEQEFLDLRTDEEKKEQAKMIIEEENNKKAPKVDEIYLAVKDYVMNQEHVSTNNLMVVFKFNYLKAFNYITQLEKEGIIGPSNGTKPRVVLANKEKQNVAIETEELEDEID